MSSDPQVAALLAHVLAQTRENVNFLASHNYISAADAADISRRLSTPQNNDSLANSMQALSVVGPPRESAPSPVRRSVPPPPRVTRARAKWAYNENGQERDDLSFSAGEIIEVIDETNSDWWTGKCRGRQGLFPSNYVEKVDSPPSGYQPPPMGMPMAPMAPMQMGPPPSSYSSPVSEKPMYQPYGPVAPVPSQPVVVVQQQEPPKKHSRFGGLGNTMANSAAGGVGFGAGAAIGSGIVNAIF